MAYAHSSTAANVSSLAATGNAGDTYDTGWFQIGLADRLTGAVVADQNVDVTILQSGDGTRIDLLNKTSVPAATFSSADVTGGSFTIDLQPSLPFQRILVKNTAASATTQFRAYIRSYSLGPR